MASAFRLGAGAGAWLNRDSTISQEVFGMLRSGVLVVGLAALALSACATTSGAAPKAGGKDGAAGALPAGLDPGAQPDPFPSTYEPLPRDNMAIVGATIFTGTDQRIENGVVVITDGRSTPADALRRLLARDPKREVLG